jgi:hypothetical protein
VDAQLRGHWRYGERFLPTDANSCLISSTVFRPQFFVASSAASERAQTSERDRAPRASSTFLARMLMNKPCGGSIRPDAISACSFIQCRFPAIPPERSRSTSCSEKPLSKRHRTAAFSLSFASSISSSLRQRSHRSRSLLARVMLTLAAFAICASVPPASQARYALDAFSSSRHWPIYHTASSLNRQYFTRRLQRRQELKTWTRN